MKLKHKIWYDEQISAVRMKMKGEVTREDAIEILIISGKLWNDRQPSGTIVDLSQSPNGMSRDARKIFKKVDSDNTSRKVALVGTTPVTRMLAKIVMATLGKSRSTKFFATDDEAVAWISRESGVKDGNT